MKPALGPRAQAALILALVATLGALLGILGDRLVASQRSSSEPGDAPGRMNGDMMPASRFGGRLTERLDLTAEQRSRIDAILAEQQAQARTLTSEYQPQFRALADQTRERIEAVLTDEQREQMRAMRQRMRRPGDMRRGMPGVRPDSPRPALDSARPNPL